MSDDALLSVRDLVIGYPGRRGRLFRAVHGVGFDVAAGQTVGLVGESGSGKTTMGRAVQGLLRPRGGEIRLAGKPVAVRSARDRRAHAAEVQTVFQDPYGSLNPARPVGTAVEETLLVQQPNLTRREAAARTADEFVRVGLPAEATRATRRSSPAVSCSASPSPAR